MTYKFTIEPPITAIEKIDNKLFIDLRLNDEEAREQMQALLVSSYSRSVEWDHHQSSAMDRNEHTFIAEEKIAVDFLKAVKENFNRFGEVKVQPDERQKELTL